MVGWFSLNVPSGLGLYYLSNTFITTAQQVWLRKLGGADIADFMSIFGDVAVGKARRTGTVAGSADDAVFELSGDETAEAEDGAGQGEDIASQQALAITAAPAAPAINRRCKRKKPQSALAETAA